MAPPVLMKPSRHTPTMGDNMASKNDTPVLDDASKVLLQQVAAAKEAGDGADELMLEAVLKVTKHAADLGPTDGAVLLKEAVAVGAAISGTSKNTVAVWEIVHTWRNSGDGFVDGEGNTVEETLSKIKSLHTKVRQALFKDSLRGKKSMGEARTLAHAGGTATDFVEALFQGTFEVADLEKALGALVKASETLVGLLSDETLSTDGHEEAIQAVLADDSAPKLALALLGEVELPDASDGQTDADAAADAADSAA